jgi:hypothetical protein
VPGIRYPAEFIGGFAGANQRRSVMEPDAEGLESAYRAGEATSVLGDLFGSLTPFATASTLSRVGALPGAAVIKPKGGNWLAGSFSAERALEPLRKPMPSRATDAFGNEVPNPLANSPMYTENAALNKWIDTKLTKYVKNEMATPEDPVRALAERGTLHFEPQDAPRPMGFEREGRTLRENREASGYPIEGLGKSNLAKDWEALADINIQPDKAEVFQSMQLVEANPWLAKVSPDTPVYGMNLSTDMSKLGFPHIIDELTNAMNPNSGLPASLRLTPQQLEKITVPQAVERVAKINEWRAAQKVEADALKARNPATFEHRAYETVPGTTEPNEKGLRWVELKASTEPVDVSSMLIQNAGKYSILEPGQKLSWKDPKTGRVLFDTPEKAAKAYTEHKHYASLEDALKYEGDVMGHCVGGYCPDVIEGRSRIYSLRDKKGEPHVTIEVAPHNPNLESVYAKQNLPELYAKYSADRNKYSNSWPEFLKTEAPELLNATENKIIQIKGKANRAPKDEYLPFVQDFVRSGRWSSVGDLGNTGLIRINPDSDLGMNLRAANVTAPEFVTQRQLSDLLDKYGRTNLPPSSPEGYAAGGAVRMNEGGKPPKRRASDLPGYGEGSAGALSDVVRGFMGEKPAEPTNPSELFRLAQALGAFPPVAGAVGAVKRPAGAAAALRELLKTEAPAQSAAAREALRRAYRTGHEHSVVGLTEAGVPGEVVTSGNRTRVIPSAADVSRAVSDPQRRAIVDFHTHPSDVSGLRVSPSADDVAFYADYERGAWPRTLKTFIASPPSTGGGRASTAYSFFETDVPRRVYDKDLFEKAELELQNAGRLGRFDRVRRDPAFAAAFESGAVDLQDLLGEAAPLLLLERRAAQGAGRQRLDLGANAVAPNAELRDFYEMIREPAQEFLKKNKLKKGGAVKIETNPTLMADELLFKGYRR